MALIAGSVVAVRHYSLINVFTSIVANAWERLVEIKLPKECQNSTFIRGDPVVVAFENGDSTEIKGGMVVEYKKEEGLLTYEEDIYDEEKVRMRSFARFPVSLYADYKVVEEGGHKKNFALVKDISEFGIMLYSTESHFKGLRLNLDIYLTREILNLTAEIVRKVEHDGYIEYGLRIKHNGPFVFTKIKNYVRKSQEELTSKFSS
ncbi:MAG: PilZ domain-containing protein [Bacillota bacterium]